MAHHRPNDLSYRQPNLFPDSKPYLWPYNQQNADQNTHGWSYIVADLLGTDAQPNGIKDAHS